MTTPTVLRFTGTGTLDPAASTSFEDLGAITLTWAMDRWHLRVQTPGLKLASLTWGPHRETLHAEPVQTTTDDHSTTFTLQARNSNRTARRVLPVVTLAVPASGTVADIEPPAAQHAAVEHPTGWSLTKRLRLG